MFEIGDVSEERIERHTFLGVTAIIGSPPMREVLRRAQRAAQGTAAVLITGESGSGKEIVARAVHHYSLRCSKPWVDVSCGALPEHLMESELFGYEKGAFSGADSTKPGLFEMANGGTLMLDEIGELDPKMQVKLLRVLDGTPYYRLGGTRKVTVDVRIVAATNQDLQQAVKAGRFRNDLYHRLDQIHLQVPPLRERAGDIVALARFFLDQINGPHPRLALSPGSLQALVEYSWPGNVRELRNALTKAATFAEDDMLEIADLPSEIRSADFPSPAATSSTSGTNPDVLNLDAMERQMIETAVNQTGGQYQRAADLLGISRRTLSRKMKDYHIREQEDACVVRS